MWDSLSSEECRTCHFKTSNKIACEQMEGQYLDKENLQPFDTKNNEELSLYDNNTLETYNSTSTRCRRPLEEHDSTSQDSGYGASYHGEKFLSYASPTRNTAASFSSGFSMEDEFFDFSDVEPLEKTTLPQDFNKLITNPLIMKKQDTESSKDTAIRPLFRRALSLQNAYDNNTPSSSRVRTNLFKGDNDSPRSFKRPEPPSCLEMIGVKRSKIFEDDDMEASVPISRPVLQRPLSATEESIMCAVQRSSTEPDLIGDFTKNYSLPLTPSRHQDLKAISPDTLAGLMRGKYNNTVTTFKVIDCRYPYEFNGGHIEGALNIYTKEQCLELLHCRRETSQEESQQRHILVFHCEFSSERGPNLYRFLRKEDRNKNESVYPSLNFPEMYLLEGGYKKFFEAHSEMCSPVAYTTMLHPGHEAELRHFRQKSKTWNCDSRQRSNKNFKRLGR